LYFSKLFDAAMKMQNFVLIFTKCPTDEFEYFARKEDGGDFEKQKLQKKAEIEKVLGFQFEHVNKQQQKSLLGVFFFLKKKRSFA
jgi:hypothetical protein